MPDRDQHHLSLIHIYRWLFSGGAAFGSLAWFTGLGFGARALAVPLGRPSVWRVIDIVIGVIMVAIAIRLATLS